MATVTRETVYDQVWAKPKMTVAAEYGVTGTALKKTCKRHDIPTPSRGYWQQIAHGQTIEQTPLPDASKSSGTITITGSNRPPVADPIEQAEVTCAWSLAVPPHADDHAGSSSVVLDRRRPSAKAARSAGSYLTALPVARINRGPSP
jgi:hypothetical protein